MNQQDSNEPQHNPYKALSVKLKFPSDAYYEDWILGFGGQIYSDAIGYANKLIKEIGELDRKKAQAKAALFDLFTNKALVGVGQDSLAYDLYYHDDKMAVEDIAAALGCTVDTIHEVIGEHEHDAGCANCGVTITNVARYRDEVASTDYDGDEYRFVDLLCDECEAEELLATRDPETLRKMPYAEYLKTDHWKETRQGALKRAGYRCQLCNAKGALHVHHRTYERRGSEIASDLLVLCANCHQTFHDNHKVVKD